MKLRDDPQLFCAGRTAGMPVRAAGNSELRCGLVREQHLSPRRARRRPSTDHVGLLAGASPANGPSGCNPSAPSPWCSPCPSSSPRRRTRCSSHRMPTLLICAHPPRSLTTGCSLWMAGDHWTLRWKLFLMAAKRGSVLLQRGCAQELAPSAMGQPTAAVPVAVRALLEARTTTGRRSCCPPPPGRTT